MGGSNHHETLLRRHEVNPILTVEAWPYPANTVFNPGATRLADGTTVLLCRVEDRRGHSHLCVARSANGIDGWEIDDAPTFEGDPERYPHELWGVEDPRITYLEELGRYGIVYTCFGWGGPGVAIALTDDFRSFERIGMVMPPEDKDAALLPVRIDGLWAMIHRPVTSVGAHIWISYSPDLKHWGSHRLLLEARHGAWWDAGRIGLSPPLIQTDDGWLMIYHGVRSTPSGCLYRLGLALLDLAKPEVCLMRSDRWIFSPETPHEREGDVGNVVFPCGHTIEADGDTLNLYYGAADTCICLARGSIEHMIDWLRRNATPSARASHLAD